MLTEADTDVGAVAAIEVVPTILDVVCRTTGMGFATVARVTEDRWIACAVRDDIAFGLRPGGELRIETTICHEILRSGRAVVIDHVAEDAVYRDHATPAIYGFQSYISMPIVLANGKFFGTLCAIDPRPARLNNPETIGMFKMFADLIASHLNALDRMAMTEAALLNERQTAALREEFIAVLGHDLRNPLAAIDAGMQQLLRTPLNDKAKQTVELVCSSVRRMGHLITNVLDFARGRLGGGLVLDCTAIESVEPVLSQVVAELRAASPGQAIEMRLSLLDAIACDRNRIGQLFSNLLGNALTHGAADRPIRVQATTESGVFELVVANAGEPISPAALEHLFEPFFRAAGRPGRQGLGLGLYIASAIARAHRGTLDVVSTPEETRFTFRMPVA